MIVSGHVGRAVWQIAWPTVVNTLILNAYNVINGLFLGQLPNSRDALAAAGMGGNVMMVQFAALMGLAAGTGALVSQFLGADRVEDANESTRQSLLLSAIIGFVTAIPLIVWAHPMMALIGAKGNVISLGGDYTAIISYFSVFSFVYMIVITALRSAGDVKSAMYAGAVILSVNIVLDWILILGPGPFVKYGIYGAAWSTGISRVLGVLVTLWFLRRSVLGSSLSHFTYHREITRKIFKIGWPAMLTNLAWTLAMTVYMKVLSYLPGGTVAVSNFQAAWTIGLRIESLAFMPGLAYSQAATPLVGQNLGAEQPDRAAHSAWIATLHAVLIMSAFGAAFLLIPRVMVNRFTTDVAVAGIAAWYLRINALAEPFLAVNMVLRGALQGAGDTFVPAIITLATNYAVRLPLAWLLAIQWGYGPNGAWIAMSASTILSGLLMIIWFQMGRWKTRRVTHY